VYYVWRPNLKNAYERMGMEWGQEVKSVCEIFMVHTRILYVLLVKCS
jgi:hypothetical protein